MRVLIFNGSPRPKGNTKQMIQAFCEGLETAGHEYGVYEVCKMNITDVLPANTATQREMDSVFRRMTCSLSIMSFGKLRCS